MSSHSMGTKVREQCCFGRDVDYISGDPGKRHLHRIVPHIPCAPPAAAVRRNSETSSDSDSFMLLSHDMDYSDHEDYENYDDPFN